MAINKFEDLGVPQVNEAAEYYGATVGKNKSETIADLASVGVTVEMYNSWREEVAKAIAKEAEALEAQKLEEAETAARIAEAARAKEELLAYNNEAAVAEQVARAPQSFLIKMDRENWFFQWGKYEFTENEPYAIMPADDAQRLLASEEGFRQAWPDEVASFYETP